MVNRFVNKMYLGTSFTFIKYFFCKSEYFNEWYRDIDSHIDKFRYYIHNIFDTTDTRNCKLSRFIAS